MVPQVGQIYRFTGHSEDPPMKQGDLITVLKLDHKMRADLGPPHWLVTDVSFLHEGRVVTFQMPSVKNHPESWTGLFQEVG